MSAVLQTFKPCPTSDESLGFPLPLSRLQYTRDIVILSHCCRHFRYIAKDIRAQRQDINRLLADFVKDVEGFRLFMKQTGAIIVAIFVTCFFTGEEPPNIFQNSLNLVLPDMNTGTCESWISLLKGEIVSLGNGWIIKENILSRRSPG